VNSEIIRPINQNPDVFPGLYIYRQDLGKDEALVLLMSSKHKGIIISNNINKSFNIGDRAEDVITSFDLNNYTKFNGKIVLSN
jgi:hypothetical protein